MIYKIAFIVFLVALPLNASAQMRVVRPSSGETDSNIRFTGSPQTESIRDLQNKFNAMSRRVNTLEDKLNQANQQIESINAALQTLNQELATANNTSANNTAILQNIINCGAAGKFYNGGGCVTAADHRR